MKHSRFLSGVTLIEIMVAVVLISVGLVTVMRALIISSNANLHTNLTSYALNVLKTQVELDSRAEYDTFGSGFPPLEPVTDLPDGVITREVVEDISKQIKKAHYVLTWKLNTPVSIQTDYELIKAGISND